MPASAADVGKPSVVEVSYEVCNKVGGIYTVIVSKMPLMLRNTEKYLAIGPYYEKQAALELVREEPPPKLASVFDALGRRYGMRFHYGKWLIRHAAGTGQKPEVILIDPGRYKEKLNGIKADLWESFGVDSLAADSTYDEPLPWSKATGMLIQEMSKARLLGQRPVAHFHEWLTGAGLLHLKGSRSSVRTVFLTHATMLGRAIAGTGRDDLYGMIREGLANRATVQDDVARKYNVMGKFSLERASANNADVFATVSEITGRECQFMFGKKPDIYLYNGLDSNRFPLMENLSELHIRYREEMKKFVAGYFCPYYSIDLEDALFFFISGRFEFRNKGVDMFIDALGSLNERLKGAGSKKVVVAFIWIPAYVRESRNDVLNSLGVFRELEEDVNKESERMAGRILRAFVKGREPEKTEIFDQDFLFRLKEARSVLDKLRGQNPPVSPFVLDENEITSALQRSGLNNEASDPVKVIYYPTYLSASDNMLGMDYYKAMTGSHLGVFPSYYEPWGYTPLEAAALGLQAITTDLAGFGIFIRPELRENEASIMVLPRDGVPYEESVSKLEDMLYRIYRMDRKDRVAGKIRSKELSGLADWNAMVRNYFKAYEMALKK
jgi:glycogen(starch) synthase